MKFMPRLKIYSGSNRKNTFNAETFEARSYQHWVYVCKINGKVIFNNYNYSHTTSKHQNEMRSFLSSQFGIETKDIIFVNQGASLSNGIKLNSFYETLALAEVQLESSKGKSASYIAERQKTIAETKATIKQLKELGGTSDRDYSYIKTLVQNSETSRLESNKAKSKIQRDKLKALKSQFGNVVESLDAITI